MNFFSGILIGARESWAYKFRSFLTMVGIILGVAALVAMMGIVRGYFTFTKQWIVEMGGLAKVSITEEDPPVEQLQIAGISPGRTLRDATAILGASPLAVAISPEVDLRAVVQRGSKVYTVRAQGVQYDVLEINNYEISSGRFFGDMDLERCAQVCVIGSAVRRALYEPNEDPLGTTLKVNGLPFIVVGLLKHYEIQHARRNAIDWKNQIVFVPISTMQKRLVGDDLLTWLNVKTTDVRLIDSLAEQLENTLLQTHRGIRDFRVETREEMVQRFAEVETTFTFSLGGVAAISLLIGGIGIMNVMLASINERIREIGIRKAFGARDGDIFLQFIAEAVGLSILGGLLGLVASVGLVSMLKATMSQAGVVPEISLQAMLIGFSFSVGVGVLSGIYPAFRAARLDSIEALRYE